MRNDYKIIYADPPWRYNDRRANSAKFGGGACCHYPLLGINELRALNVEGIADDNAALFLWCTFPRLDDGITLFDAWGFDYKTVAFSWVKLNPRMYANAMENGIGSEFPGMNIQEVLDKLRFFGIGYYAKSCLEICLLGIRGRLKPVSNYVSSVVFAPRMRHSAKPPVVRERIVELFGDIPRVELFAREAPDGWDVVGDEIDGRDIRDVLPKRESHDEKPV